MALKKFILKLGKGRPYCLLGRYFFVKGLVIKHWPQTKISKQRPELMNSYITRYHTCVR